MTSLDTGERDLQSELKAIEDEIARRAGEANKPKATAKDLFADFVPFSELGQGAVARMDRRVVKEPLAMAGAKFDETVVAGANAVFQLAGRFNKSVFGLLEGATGQTGLHQKMFGMTPDEMIASRPIKRSVQEPTISEPNILADIGGVVGEAMGFLALMGSAGPVAGTTMRMAGVPAHIAQFGGVPAAAFTMAMGETGDLAQSMKQGAAAGMFQAIGQAADKLGAGLASKGLWPRLAQMATETLGGTGVMIASPTHREQIYDGYMAWTSLPGLADQLEAAGEEDKPAILEKIEKAKATFNRALVVVAGDLIAGGLMGATRVMPEVRQAYEQRQLRKAFKGTKFEKALDGTNHTVTKNNEITKPGWKKLSLEDLTDVDLVSRVKRSIIANNRGLHLQAYGAEPTTDAGIWRTSTERGASMDGRVTVGEDGSTLRFQPNQKGSRWRDIKAEELFPAGAEKGSGLGADMVPRIEAWDNAIRPHLEDNETHAMWDTVLEWAESGRADLDPQLRDELSAVFADDALLSDAARAPNEFVEGIARMMTTGTAADVQRLSKEAGFLRVGGDDAVQFGGKGEGDGGAKKSTEGVLHSVKQLTASAARYFTGMGKAGAEGAEGLQRQSRAEAKETGIDQQAYKKLVEKHKLSDSEMELAMKLVDERVESAPDNVRKFVDELRPIADRGMEAAKKFMKRIGEDGKPMELEGSGRFFPMTLNARGRKVMAAIGANKRNAAALKVAEKMVADGKATNVKAAIKQLKSWYNETQLRDVNPYLERTRKTELPEELVEWNPNKVLPGTFRRAWKTITAAQEFGYKLKGSKAVMDKAESIASRIAEETGDKALGEQFLNYLRSQYGRTPGLDKGNRKWANRVSSYLTLSKLGFSFASALRNGFQGWVNGAHYPWMYYFKSLKDMPPQTVLWLDSIKWMRGKIPGANKVRAHVEKLERMGLVGGVSSISEIEAGIKNWATDLAMKPFSSVETMNHARAATVAWKGMEIDLQKLIKKTGQEPETFSRARKIMERIVGVDESSLRSRIEKLGISNDQIKEALKRGRWTPDELEAAAYKMVADTQFRMDAATKRFWYDSSPWLRVPMKFKQFAFDQYFYALDYVWGEAKRGNIAPTVRFFLANVLAGEIYHAATDILQDKERSWVKKWVGGDMPEGGREWAESILSKFATGGGIGWLMDLTYGVGGFMLGPIKGSYDNLMQAVAEGAQDYRQAPGAIMDAIKRETRVLKDFDTLYSKFQARVMGNESESRAVKIANWRSRTYDWKNREEAPGFIGMAQAAVLDAAEGPSFSRTGKNSYAYRGADEALDSGNVKEAGSFLVTILDRVEPSEWTSKISDIRNALQERGPKGAIGKQDLPQFLRRYSRDQIREFYRLQASWNRDVEKAIVSAFRQLREKRR